MVISNNWKRFYRVTLFNTEMRGKCLKRHYFCIIYGILFYNSNNTT